MMYGVNRGSIKIVERISENSIGVEIGVWKGDSSKLFLQKAKYLHLVDSWSVVPYINSNENGGYEGYLKKYAKRVVGSSDPKKFQRYYDKVYNSVVAEMKNKPVTIYRCQSKEFFAAFNDEVDWVYVDAAHDFDGCLDDLRNSLKIIRSNGSIFADDYGTAKPGVKKAIDTFISETGLILDNFYKNQVEIKV